MWIVLVLLGQVLEIHCRDTCFPSNKLWVFFSFSSLCSPALPPVLEGQYFSEEQMRIREPLLYEQYIGQYLTDEEVMLSLKRFAFIYFTFNRHFTKKFRSCFFSNFWITNLVGAGALPGGHAGRCTGGTRRKHSRARPPPPQLLPGAAHPESSAGGAGERGGSTGGGRGWRRRR